MHFGLMTHLSAQDGLLDTTVQTLGRAANALGASTDGAVKSDLLGKNGLPSGRLKDTLSEARDVVLMLRTKDFRDLNTLKGDLTVAGERAGCKWPPAGLKLESIDANAWQKLRSAFGIGDETSVMPGVELTSGNGVQLLATDKKNYFQIRVAPDRQMADAELSYRVAGSKQTQQLQTSKMVPGKSTDDAAEHPLRFDNSGIGGHYSLTLPSQWEPDSISIRSSDGKPPVKYEWPNNTLVLGRIEDFEGSIPKMFDALKDADIMGVPVRGLEQSQNVTVVLADFVRDFATPTSEWISANEIRFRVAYEKDIPCDRVWFLFPLDQESSKKVSNLFEDRLPQGDYDLAESLRNADNPYPIVEVSDPPLIDISGDPSWLQLPLLLAANGVPTYFERTFTVSNRPALQKRYPEKVQALYLYEKDMQTEKFPHRVLPVKGEQGNKHLLEQTMPWTTNRSR